MGMLKIACDKLGRRRDERQGCTVRRLKLIRPSEYALQDLSFFGMRGGGGGGEGPGKFASNLGKT